MKARTELALILAILLAAAALRSYRLADLPPGVEHDEVAEWQIARGILAGRHAIFFREAYGQEPAYLYLQAVSISLLGDHVLALRFTSFAVAMLTMAAGYRLMRRLFGTVTALASLAFIAVTLWPVFVARVAIRGMTLPLVMCLAADALFSNVKRQASNVRRQWIIAGMWFGLAAYTYLAARAIPILLLGFAAYLALWAREQMQGRWIGFATMLLIAAILAAPLAVYVWRNPDAQFRVDEVAGPLKQLQQGDPSAVLAGVRDTLLMFSVRGDQTVRDNWPGRPVFADPLSAMLFYVGLLVTLGRWRRSEYAFLLIWLAALLTPTMVTAGPPNFVRALGALPPIMAMPGVGVAALADILSRKGKYVGVLCVGILILGLVLTIRDYFRWSAHPETQFVWQTDLAAVARHLDSASDLPHDVAIAGLSNETMDDDSLHLLMKRRDLDVRWFDSRTTLIIPSGGGQMFIPRIVPIEPVLRERLIRWGAREHLAPSGRFTWYDLVAIPSPPGEASSSASVTVSVLLDNGMMFLGYEASNLTLKRGDDATVLTYWSTVSAQPPLKAFLHLTDASGKIITQSDGLNAPPQFWRSGDVIVQLHHLAIPTNTAPGTYELKLGLYNAQTQARAQFHGLGDHLRLPNIEVRP